MAQPAEQIEWLSLVNVTGPFLVPEILDEIFPQGIPHVLKTIDRQRLQSAYDEWRETVEKKDKDLELIHKEWIHYVINKALEFEESDLIKGADLGDEVVYESLEHGGVVEPQYAIRPEGKSIQLFINSYSPETKLDQPLLNEDWPVSPVDRMTLLCRSNEVRVGLVTNGEEWVLVNAPIGNSSGYATWYARLWWQEPTTLKAFCSLLGLRRVYGEDKDSLPELLEKSSHAHEEVNNTLGEQVRHAVGVLVSAVDRADQGRNGELLEGVQPQELYEAGLTVMMRLVFTLCAEERELLLLGDPNYDESYAVTNLRAALREEADLQGEETLEKREDAWSRLLSIFRIIYGGVEHESLRLPALGGSLFDPDRFPFLEGRLQGTSWKDSPANPLPIDNRTVLLLLRALQVLEHRGGAQLLSYRGLDVEQIGHVYEGLLEYTVTKIEGLSLGLIGSKDNPNAMVRVDELLAWEGASLTKNLSEITGRPKNTIKNALKKDPDETLLPALVNACRDEDMARQILPFVSLIKKDSWGSLMIYHEGEFAVVPGPGRRATGAHYTPKVFAEGIVKSTLDPVIYEGPKEGVPKEDWRLKSSEELLKLKICDPAMGSGAFLVQSCRYLAECLVQAWLKAEAEGKSISVDGSVFDSLDGEEPMPQESDERLLIAKRLISERCLYGIDLNPMAVELAKLSIWLVTLQKGRPFGFLDHNFRSGDSLLGIADLEQLTKLVMHPNEKDQLRIFGRGIESAVTEAMEIRKRLRLKPIRDIKDVESMAQMAHEAREKLEPVELIADAMIGEAYSSEGKLKKLVSALDELATKASQVLEGDKEVSQELKNQAIKNLSIEQDPGKPARKTFHWALEFPEVFGEGGFDAIIGNPPYAGKNTISSAQGGGYVNFISKILHLGAHGNADLVAHFYRRAFHLIKKEATFGLIATNSIAQGDTRQAGLTWICQNNGIIYKADKRIKWPGSAAIMVSIVYVIKGEFDGALLLNGKETQLITAFLFHDGGHETPPQIIANEGKSFQGSVILGMGFTFDDQSKKNVAGNISDMEALIKKNPSNKERIFPYVGFNEVANDPKHLHHRYVINFGDMSEEEARQWPDLMNIVEAKVKPERDKVNDDFARTNWWLFIRARPQLYSSITDLDRVLVTSAQAAKHFVFAFLPNSMVYANSLNVFPLDSFASFTCMQSRIHEVWTRFMASSMKDDLRYNPTDCFETFPFLEDWQTHSELEEVGKEYYEFRAELMVQNNEGLTTTYNRFHDPDENDPQIMKLRELHAEMDKAVLKLYGWEDIDMECDFIADYEVEEGKKVPWRYKWPEEVHDEVLARLMGLNKKRYEEEVAQGLHTKGKATKKKTPKSAPKKDENQIDLF